MASQFQRPKGRDRAISALDALIKALDLAKDTCGIPPAQAALGSVSALLAFIRSSMTNEQDYVELGLSCGDVCKGLDRGLKGRRLDELGPSVLEAIEELTTTVAAIQKKIVKQGKRNAASRLLHATDDKGAIAAWRQDLFRVLQIFNTELAINTNIMVTDIHRNVLAGQEGAFSQNRSTQASVSSGELPPSPPRICYGRDDLVERVVGLAENLEPIALIGAGGIGKTSIALSVLHHPRIKNKFGDNRRFIRCDQFSASRPQFLARLSKAIGAGVENPKDLVHLQPCLSSKEVLIILDNVESVLDPQGTDAQEIYRIVNELCRFETICLCITSRISTVPPYFMRPEIPTLSIEAACKIFYRIYCGGGPSDTINNLLQRLGFHALSITLLATIASHNMWDHDRLAEEWDAHRTRILQTEYNESLAATIELSLASPTFCKLGPNARDLLGVVAFFPQGVDEKNLDWLFPTIPDRKSIFDKSCVLSLAYRNNGFITMLAPIRDYLNPKDPKSSPLLCATRDRYFGRLSVEIYPDTPEFGETRWIVSEDANVEHLLGVFTSDNTNSRDVWNGCHHFMAHLRWHKPRQTVLRPKIEGLPDDHPSKPRCLYELARLLDLVGNHKERKDLLAHCLELERDHRNYVQVARTLCDLSDANRRLGFYEEGIQQAKEGLEICRLIGNTKDQSHCLISLAWLLIEDDKLDAAEDVASHVFVLLPQKGKEYVVCESHRTLGYIYCFKGEKEKAIHHFEIALGIASHFDWHDTLFWIHYHMAGLFRGEDEFSNANTHLEQAKLHALNDPYSLGYAMELQAWVWHQQGRLCEANSEALRALEIYEKLGVAKDVGDCRKLLQVIEEAMETGSTTETVQHVGEHPSSH